MQLRRSARTCDDDMVGTVSQALNRVGEFHDAANSSGK